MDSTYKTRSCNTRRLTSSISGQSYLNKKFEDDLSCSKKYPVSVLNNLNSTVKCKFCRNIGTNRNSEKFVSSLAGYASIMLSPIQRIARRFKVDEANIRAQTANKLNSLKKHNGEKFTMKVFKRHLQEVESTPVIKKAIYKPYSKRKFDFYKCKYCPYIAPSRQVVFHMNNIHYSNDTAYKCKFCSGSYESKQKLLKHEKRHLKEIRHDAFTSAEPESGSSMMDVSSIDDENDKTRNFSSIELSNGEEKINLMIRSNSKGPLHIETQSRSKSKAKDTLRNMVYEKSVTSTCQTPSLLNGTANSNSMKGMLSLASIQFASNSRTERNNFSPVNIPINPASAAKINTVIESRLDNSSAIIEQNGFQNSKKSEFCVTCQIKIEIVNDESYTEHCGTSYHLYNHQLEVIQRMDLKILPRLPSRTTKTEFICSSCKKLFPAEKTLREHIQNVNHSECQKNET